MTSKRVWRELVPLGYRLLENALTERNRHYRSFHQVPQTPSTNGLLEPKVNPDSIIARLRAMRTAMLVKDLAYLLGMGRNTVYLMIRSGRIPSIRIGSVVRVDPVQVADWLEERTVAA